MECAHEHEQAREHRSAAVVVAKHRDRAFAVVRLLKRGAIERPQHRRRVEACRCVERAAPELLRSSL